MSERTYKLLDGSELICSEEGILSHRLEPDFPEITTDPNAEYMNLLALVDSLQQQVAELKRQLRRSDREWASATNEVVRLQEQLGERERKIEWLTNELGE
ncbi:hypothetical protein MMB75_25420 [Paenibacillus sp. P2(2022)]|uniref:hypothetical protein n=1 Tax=Paenibacillus TaxID=44249 RepID=UPI00042E1851|nr:MULTISPECIES: hypothetical protein [Paenibacillus]AHM65132.1 hypothetical protein PPSQR21_014800 [Paenibacillus polymyxa SQR-21]MDG0056969.1 hypothetical protein [Paenibacillus sp. P2(2022)]